jgi:hypothetical protein
MAIPLYIALMVILYKDGFGGRITFQLLFLIVHDMLFFLHEYCVIIFVNLLLLFYNAILTNYKEILEIEIARYCHDHERLKLILYKFKIVRFILDEYYQSIIKIIAISTVVFTARTITKVTEKDIN